MFPKSLQYTFLAAVAVAGINCSPTPSQSHLGQRDDTSWHKYVRSPSSNIVKPVSIVPGSIKGKVANPNDMVNGAGQTVFMRGDGDDVPELVVDFGQNVVGLLTINFNGSLNSSSPGLPGLKLAFSETLQFLTDRSDFTRSDNAGGSDKLTQGTDQIAVQNGQYVWKNLNGCQHGKQVCADGLHGFRYVKIRLEALSSDAPYTSSFGSVSISSLSLEWSAYLGTPNTFTGWFECSDEALTQWWYDAVYTVDVGTDVFLANETEPRGASSPSLEGKQVIFDGAKRDRDPYVGDLAVASLTSYLSHNFPEASRNVLEDLAQHQRSDGWIPPASINGYTLPLFDYPLWWVVCSVDLVMYTGDTDYANKYWNVLKKNLDEYYPSHTDQNTNLLNKDANLGYGDYAFLPRSGPITYYNALYAHALSYAGQLAGNLGRSDDAARWINRSKTVGDALMKHNFDNSVGAFYDGGPCPNQPAGTVCNVHAQDGNSIAVLAGLTDQNTSNRVLNYWNQAASKPYGNAFYDNDALSGGFSDRVYAFISYFEIAARFATPGASSSGFDELRRLYGWMSTHDPKITMWEGIGPNGSPYEGGFTSMAHGWSTGVVPVLSNYVLGVKPVEPGFARWEVCAVVEGGGLSWAKGTVPTPNGGITVSWSLNDNASGVVLTLTVDAPKGTRGDICVPTTKVQNPKVTLNGRKLPSGINRIGVQGGRNIITVGK